MRKSGQTRRAAASWFVALALALVPMAMPSPARASTTIKVNTTADTLASDGRCSLREAIRAANLNRAIGGCPAGKGTDTIVLPAGRYVLTIPGRYEDAGLTGDLDIRSNLTIRGVSAAKTIIDGNQLDRVFDVSRGSTVHLDRLTVTRGATAVYPSCEHLSNDGGGIINGGRLLVTASVVTANRIGECGGNDGGGISSSGTLTVRGTTISANSAYGAGGGISSSGDAFLIRDRIIGNVADPFDYQRAGGVDSTGYLVLSRSLVANNVGGQEWGLGGVSMAAGIISDSTIRDNASGECGSGGVFMVGAQMIRSTVSGNLATDDNCGGEGAGGLVAINSEVVNSTISGNLGASGRVGGIYSDGSTIVSSTITANITQASDVVDGTYPGGLRALAGSQTLIRNSIVAGNLGSTGEPADCDGVVTSDRHNLIGTLADCTFQKHSSDLIGLNPLLGPLADNGGPTLTHMLRPGSPALDAWYDTAVGPGATCPAFDQRGVRRPQDGNHDGRASCDIGAVERMP